MFKAFPYLAIRAFEQEMFEHVFHARRDARMWICPHCGHSMAKQANLLAKHFKKCEVLRHVEKEVVKANTPQNQNGAANQSQNGAENQN